MSSLHKMLAYFSFAVEFYFVSTSLSCLSYACRFVARIRLPVFRIAIAISRKQNKKERFEK